MATDENNGAAQAPPAQVKMKVLAEQCTVEGGAKIKIYASSCWATITSLAVAIGTFIVAGATCETAQVTRDMFVAANLPVFTIEGGWNRDPHSLGITLTNQGKGPAHMRLLGLANDRVSWLTPKAAEGHPVLGEPVPPSMFISYPAFCFDAFAQEYASKQSLGTVSGLENLLQKQPGLFSSNNPITCWIEYEDVSHTRHGQVFFFVSEKDPKTGEYKYTVIPGRYYDPMKEETPEEARPKKARESSGKAEAPARESPGGVELEQTIPGAISGANTISGPSRP